MAETTHSQSHFLTQLAELREQLTEEGKAVGGSTVKDEAYGEVESVKAVSDVISPLSGEILEVNEKVVAEPETVNDDPYGDGWLVRIRLVTSGKYFPDVPSANVVGVPCATSPSKVATSTSTAAGSRVRFSPSSLTLS